MNVHNIMEEQVFARITDLYNQVKKMNPPWLTCDCEHCRLNTVSYVLNRIPPKYIVSGRGLAYNSSYNDNQLKADIDTLGIEGMRLVSAAKRPYHTAIHETESSVNKEQGAVFNFPTFLGNVYDGNNFEPLPNAKITLKLDDKIAEMMDGTWQNPCETFLSTHAAYTFWLKPVFAEKKGETRQFHFTVSITAEHYEQVIYNFTIPITSDESPVYELNSIYSLKIQDLYLFPVGTNNPMDI